MIPGSRDLLLQELLDRAGKSDQIKNLNLSPMNDGAMGSHLISSNKEERALGSVISECQFEDEDGVLVIASLHADEDGDLFELDLWKVDSSPLVRWPSRDAIHDVVYATPNE